MAKGTSTKEEGPKREVGTKSGLSVKETWAKYLIENEHLAKNGKRPLTDEQLIAKMQEEFPSKRDATTITRCTMVRGVYNKGTNMFAADGPSGVAGRPTSRRYDAAGNAVAARGRLGEDGLPAATKPKAEPKAKKTAKKIAKKTTKKVVRKKVAG
jgi:hypothetical protein